MSLVEYGRILLRRGWIIIVLAVLTAGAAYVFSQQLPKTYRASQIVRIQPARNDLGLTNATSDLLESYVVYLYSSYRAQEVIDNLQLDLLAVPLRDATTIAPFRNNLTIQIDTTGQDCAVLNSIVTEWGNLFVRYRNQQNQLVRQEDRVDAQLADVSRCPVATTPNVIINTVVGGIIGFILGCLIVFLMEYLESAVLRRREDVERALDIPVIATIPSKD